MMLRYTEREAWRLTPYKILKFFKYHKEYNPAQFGRARTQPKSEYIDDIDAALGGF
nr:MAG TPA: hypothetical protein [Caudoviricetes sp.]